MCILSVVADEFSKFPEMIWGIRVWAYENEPAYGGGSFMIEITGRTGWDATPHRYSTSRLGSIHKTDLGGMTLRDWIRDMMTVIIAWESPTHLPY